VLVATSGDTGSAVTHSFATLSGLCHTLHTHFTHLSTARSAEALMSKDLSSQVDLSKKSCHYLHLQYDAIQ